MGWVILLILLGLGWLIYSVGRVLYALERIAAGLRVIGVDMQELEGRLVEIRYAQTNHPTESLTAPPHR